MIIAGRAYVFFSHSGQIKLHHNLSPLFTLYPEHYAKLSLRATRMARIISWKMLRSFSFQQKQNDNNDTVYRNDRFDATT